MKKNPVARAWFLDLVVAFGTEADFQASLKGDELIELEGYSWWGAETSAQEFICHSRRWFALIDWLQEEFGIEDFSPNRPEYRSFFRLAECVAITLQCQGKHQACFSGEGRYVKIERDRLTRVYKSDYPSLREAVNHLNLFAKEVELTVQYLLDERDQLKEFIVGGSPFLTWGLEEAKRWISDPYPVYGCKLCSSLIPPAKRSPEFCSFTCRQQHSNKRAQVEAGKESIDQLNESYFEWRTRGARRK